MKKILLLILLANLLTFPVIASDSQNPITSYEKAKVIEIKEETQKIDDDAPDTINGGGVFTDHSGHSLITWIGLYRQYGLQS